MRAREPDESGYVRDVYWERFGDGEPTVLFLPAWAIVHSRIWKAQIHYFARHYRVLTFDPRGNGRSGRPRRPTDYTEERYAADALAVMDATGTEQAVVVGLSMGAQRGLMLAASHPERVLAAAFVGPALPLAPNPARDGSAALFDEQLESYKGWTKYNRHYWLEDYRGFLEFFFSQVFPEPHSTKQIEDAVGWGLETDPETLVLTATAAGIQSRAEALELCARVRCPVLVIHGELDAIRPPSVGKALAEATGGRFVLMPGAGHCPQARKPVQVNLLLREFVERTARAPPEAASIDSRKEETWQQPRPV